jgi:hypothetical protein
MYCGVSLENTKGVSLDRIDSSRGYHFDNVTPCCGRCNVAKNDMKSDEFFAWIDRVYEFKTKMMNRVQETNYSEKEIRKMENTFKNKSLNRNSIELVVKEGR